MGSFSFKSSGTTAAGAAASALAVTAPPIGIVTPLALGNDDLLKMNTDLVAQLTDNLRNLIMTNWGERLGFYDFGANLRPLTVDLVTLDDFDAQAVDRIKAAISKWMPYVEPVDYESEVDRANGRPGSVSAIVFTLTFAIPSLNVRDKKLKITLFVI